MLSAGKAREPKELSWWKSAGRKHRLDWRLRMRADLLADLRADLCAGVVC